MNNIYINKCVGVCEHVCVCTQRYSDRRVLNGGEYDIGFGL